MARRERRVSAIVKFISLVARRRIKEQSDLRILILACTLYFALYSEGDIRRSFENITTSKKRFPIKKKEKEKEKTHRREMPMHACIQRVSCIINALPGRISGIIREPVRF